MVVEWQIILSSQSPALTSLMPHDDGIFFSGKIIEGSPAARCQNLKVNDRIIAINGVNILRMHHGEIVNLIRDSGNVVTLTVGAPEGTYSRL